MSSLAFLFRRMAPGVLLLSLASGTSLAGWYIHEVDAPRRFQHSSVATDASGHPAVAYGGDRLYYASWDGQEWTVQTVEPDCGGKYPSLAFDSAGRPAISYHGPADRALKLARWDGTAWDIEVVANDDLLNWPGTGVGWDTSLAFDSDDHPAIACYDSTHSDLVYARWDGSAWSIETVDADGDVGRYASLALDAAGLPVVAYQDAGDRDLKLARSDGVSWTIELVDGTDVGYTSLALDSSGHPLIAYYDWGDQELRLARWDGSWTIETVDSDGNVGPYASLRLDATDRPVVSYQDADTGSVKLARQDGAWSIETVDQGGFTSLTLDEAGRPAISYHQEDSGELRLARWDSAWDIKTLDTAELETAGPDNSLAIDGNGMPAVAYSRAGEVRLAHWDGTVWEIKSPDRGKNSCLAFDGTTPAIGYYSPGEEALKLARWNDPDWRIEVVDSGTERFIECSLVIDTDSNPFMVYTAGIASSALHAARWVGGVPQLDIVEDSVYYGPSLVLDPLGTPTIAYTNHMDLVMMSWWTGSVWDQTSAFSWPWWGYAEGDCLAFDDQGYPNISFIASGVMLTRYDGSRWSEESVDQSGNAGGWTSLARDSSGNLGLSYSMDMKLKYAYLVEAEWHVETVGRSGLWLVEADTSLGFDAEDNPWISYYDGCLGDMRVATTTGPAVLYRGNVAALDPGWKTTALPLGPQNDDETPPFPVTTSIPGTSADADPGSAPLTLYRLLWDYGGPARNTLRLTKGDPGLELRY